MASKIRILCIIPRQYYLIILNYAPRAHESGSNGTRGCPGSAGPRRVSITVVIPIERILIIVLAIATTTMTRQIFKISISRFQDFRGFNMSIFPRLRDFDISRFHDFKMFKNSRVRQFKISIFRVVNIMGKI